MQDPSNDNQHMPRSGASLGPFAPFASPLDPDHLPLVVWLRGDESYFADFNLSADEAMNQLKIRRSRLTQISGRELRVGRTRIDRYIRPVYRSVDIDAYLAWTRQTASHQKSSDALKEAALILSTKSEELTEELLQKSAGISPELISQLLFMQRQLQTLLLEKTAASDKFLGSTKAELIRAVDDRYFRLSAKVATFAALIESESRLNLKIEALSNSMLLFVTEIQKFSADTHHLEKQQQLSIAEQSAEICGLRRIVEDVARQQLENSRRPRQKFQSCPARNRDMRRDVSKPALSKFPTKALSKRQKSISKPRYKLANNPK